MPNGSLLAQRTEVHYQISLPRNRLKGFVGVVPSIYRLLAFAIAVIQIYFVPLIVQPVIPPFALLLGIGIYTIIKALQPLHWHQRGTIGYYLLGIDIVICALLLLFSGGIYSPFLLYTLTPILTAALFLDGKITFTVAGISVAYVIGAHIANPFFLIRLSLSELSYFFIYAIAVCLTAVLPYLANINLKQRLQAQSMTDERRRLAREIHDGISQTLIMMRWQTQRLQRRLGPGGVGLDEATQLEKLAENAQHDTRQALGLLHNLADDSGFLPQLRDCVKILKLDTGINFHLDIDTEETLLERPVELELLRICQEALTNIRRHSGARNVRISLKRLKNCFQISIYDDGRGFDVHAGSKGDLTDSGYGLSVMKERAESIGGLFQISSIPGHGTDVHVEIPLHHNMAQVLWQNKSRS